MMENHEVCSSFQKSTVSYGNVWVAFFFTNLSGWLGDIVLLLEAALLDGAARDQCQDESDSG